MSCAASQGGNHQQTQHPSHCACTLCDEMLSSTPDPLYAYFHGMEAECCLRAAAKEQNVSHEDGYPKSSC